jgi:hypothetical protein
MVLKKFRSPFQIADAGSGVMRLVTATFVIRILV